MFFDGSDDHECITGALDTSEIVNLIPYEKTLEVAKDTYEIRKSLFISVGFRIEIHVLLHPKEGENVL